MPKHSPVEFLSPLRFFLGVTITAALIVLAGCEEDVENGDTALSCPASLYCVGEFCEQVLIPAGDFSMGTDDPPPNDSYWPAGDARPEHSVHLDAYCIDRYEVTLERYEACADRGVCSYEGLEHNQRDTETIVNHYPPECNDRDDCPDRAVNAKNYWQAQAYCGWIGGRLCSEAEWERAANGPGMTKRLHPWGDDEPTFDLVNLPSTNAYSTGGEGYVEDVDICPDGVSAEGVYNLAGNVYEWVRDEYDEYNPPDDGEAADNPLNLPNHADDEVIGRGSCFFTNSSNTVVERSVFPPDFDWG